MKEVDRRGIKHSIGDGALSVPQGPGIGRAVEVERVDFADEPGEGPLAGALAAADTAHVLVLSPVEPLRKRVHEEVLELPDIAVFDARYCFGGVPIRADTGNRAAGIVRDGSSGSAPRQRA